MAVPLLQLLLQTEIALLSYRSTKPLRTHGTASTARFSYFWSSYSMIVKVRAG